MFEAYLKPEVQEFIEQKKQESIEKIAFQKNPFPELNWSFILQQIEGKQKTIQKLPTWYQTKNIVFPPKLNIEQTSSEVTAQYKASLVSGQSLIDLTGGFGVDVLFFAKKIENVHHCDMNKELSEMVAHNLKMFQVQNVTCHQGDSKELLEELDQKWDCMYIDPSRRSDAKGKVFMLSDCTPNVKDLLPFYWQYSPHIIIKTAPILDITAGIEQLKSIKRIHIVSVGNEVKELLWEIHSGYEGEINIVTIDLQPNKTNSFEMIWKGNYAPISYNFPKKYLYEPNAALMKSNGFEAIAADYKIEKLHLHSHLFTSDDVIDFCGRTFEILNSFLYQKKEMKTHLENKKANITTRNFPETVENIRKKWKIKEGGNLYCFFTTDMDNRKIVLLCTKLNDKN